MSKQQLQPGDWLLMDFAGRSKFYVVDVIDDEVCLTKTTWLVSSGDWYPSKELFGPLYKARFIGTGKRKWYWRFLPWRDLVCPFYYPKINQ